ncbi:hypothetical protein CPB83DRAFT_884928 [Crepidotus variabilis]|uniref:F-box domain-containing protein n=1 Tax=Crepidotus variabilis TaxID=179855 RepID=A0A9P6JN01_9AGAR|nr:hypothetical protein CPB83DRAFT_884928 [Crepidotus variabilis]
MYSRRGSATQTILARKNSGTLPQYGGRLHLKSLPPIHRIPAEILCDIFMKTQEDSVNWVVIPAGTYIPPLTRGTTNPVVLSHVSSRWRAIALNLSALWSTIEVSRATLKEVHRVTTFLHRAKDHPLTASFRTSRPKRGESIDFEVDSLLLKALLSRTSTWCCINFYILHQYLPLLVEMLSRAELPRILRSVHFGAQRNPPHDSAQVQRHLDQIWTFLYNSPSLQHVSWDQECDFVIPMQAPLQQLQLIGMKSDVGIGNLIQALPHCQNLHSLDLFSVDTSPLIDDPPTEILLPKLQSIIIGTRTAVDPVFRILDCPSLSSVVIQSRSMQAPCTIRTLLDFFARSRCFLQLLSFDSEQDDEDILSLILAPEMKHVNSLKLELPYLPDSVLSMLQTLNRDGSQAFMPNLRLLELRACGQADGLWSSLLLSRWFTDLQNPSISTRGSLQSFQLSGSNLLGTIDAAFMEQNGHVIGITCM